MFRHLAIVALAFGLTAHADEKDELAKFKGKWKGVSLTVDGKETPKADAEAMLLTVEGEKYMLKIGGEDVEGTQKLDPSKTPKQIDAVRTKGDFKGDKLVGIYELTDDKFMVCFAAPGKIDRPKEFKSAAGSGNRLYVFKREK
jgi:uncharacterized protein (TIGR03067 family)